METPTLTPDQADARRELIQLREALAYGRAHPFAGYCGDDDAAADREQVLVRILRREGVEVPR